MSKIPVLAWWLIIGTAITTLSSFACLPFLAIILFKQGVNSTFIGLILGISSLAGLLIGFYCTALSDYFGRRWMILSALTLWTVAYFLFSFHLTPIAYLFINASIGICKSLFEPISQALLSDLISDQQGIKKIFKIRYLVLNIGFACGPFLGSLLTIINQKLSFIIASICIFLYTTVIAVIMHKYPLKKIYKQKQKKFFQSFTSILFQDRAFVYFLLGAICVAITYSQFESTFPQYLHLYGYNNFIYSSLLMVNALGVLCLQIPISKIADKFKIFHGMSIGGFLIFFGYLMFAFSTKYIFIAFLGMLVITLGELFISPLQNVVVNKLAVSNNYGLYFGAYNLRQLGFFIGPILGGFFLSLLGSKISFIIVALFGIIACFFFNQVHQKAPFAFSEELSN